MYAPIIHSILSIVLVKEVQDPMLVVVVKLKVDIVIIRILIIREDDDLGFL